MFKIMIMMILSLSLISCSSIINNFSGGKIDPYASSSRKITEEEINKILEERNEKVVETSIEKISNTKTEVSDVSKSEKTSISQTTPVVNNKINNSTSSSNGVIDSNFDETDQKIVDFISEKVYENSEQIKKVTVDSLNILLTEKNIRMTKREFLARTYQIIRDNDMNSFYLAAGRLLNQL